MGEQLFLAPPLFISSRLMAAVRIGDDGGTIHIQPQRRDHENRAVWRYVIEDNDGTILDDAADLRSGTGDDFDARRMMGTLLGFLGAAAEAYRHAMSGQSSENADLFPPDVTEWAYQHDGDLAALALELEEAEREPRRLRIVQRYFLPADVTDADINYRDQEAEDLDCEPDDVDIDQGETAITIAAEALRNARCTQPSTTPGPMTATDWWTDPDGSYIVDHQTGMRCEPAAFPDGFTAEELNAINTLL